mgnify:CR=1 FL=1
MKMHSLMPADGARTKAKRLGRGIGAEVDDRAVVENIELVDVDDGKLLGELVVEAALGQSAHERYLSALESGTNAAAAARPLTFMTLAGRFDNARQEHCGQT